MSADSPTTPETDAHPADPSTKRLFQAHGLRVTRQRERVYAALAASKAHPTAEDLFGAVRDDRTCLGMSLATVYNTLEALARAGLCRRIPNAGGAVRYDADMGDHVHVMLSDGRVVDLPEALSARVLKAIPADLIEEMSANVGARVVGLHVPSASAAGHA